jgi:hypothetical protein
LFGLSVIQSFEVKVMIEMKNLMSVLDHLFVNNTAVHVKKETVRRNSRPRKDGRFWQSVCRKILSM